MGFDLANITAGFSGPKFVYGIVQYMMYGVILFSLYKLAKFTKWKAKAIIIEQKGSDMGVAKEDFLMHTMNKQGVMEWKLGRAKAVVRDIPENLLIPFKRKAMVFLIKGSDGIYRYCKMQFDKVVENKVCMDCKYIFPKIKANEIRCHKCKSTRLGMRKDTVPMIIPIEKDWEEWIYRMVMGKADKYTVKTNAEVIAPFATIATVGIVCLLIIAYTYKKMGL